MVRRRSRAKCPPEQYINRELSWLEFNSRVLEEAEDPSNPLLERLKFLAIFSSNLDEFFEIRVAGLRQQLHVGLHPQDHPADEMRPGEQLAAIEEKVRVLVERQNDVLESDIAPEFAAHGIERVWYRDLSDIERTKVDRFFNENVYPVLTPLAIDSGHPFPHVHTKSLNIALCIRDKKKSGAKTLFAVVQVPSVLSRIVMVSETDGGLRFLLLEDLVAEHLDDLFRGFEVLEHTVFRVSRNTDLRINEDEAEDLLETIEMTLRQRSGSEAVRLELAADADETLSNMLVEALNLSRSDTYRIRGSIDVSGLTPLLGVEGFKELRDEPMVPRLAEPFTRGERIFDLIRGEDILVHHPFDSFGSVVDFIEQAADDPNVLAIKQTLYRTSGPTPVISALARAAENGKEVTALVELKARFEEQRNIVWARQLEQAGVHVVYGVMGLKTHCKASLVVRREGDEIVRYCHLSTGNYNPTTARVYTDLGLFTANPGVGEDVSELFNLITGYSRGYEWKKLIVAPADLRRFVISLIKREGKHAKLGFPARVVVKMNSLVEPTLIDALYKASQVGVEIDLIIRGICCLRPGVPGLSEGITVSSIVDRFLEHSRFFYFENQGDPEVFLSSADWMPRNFFRRIEIMFPIEGERAKSRIIEEIMPVYLSDSVKARRLLPTSEYVRRQAAQGEKPVRAQQALIELSRERRKKRRDKVSGEEFWNDKHADSRFSA